MCRIWYISRATSCFPFKEFIGIIDYFINKVTHYGGELGGFKEVIAEGNALLTTPKTMDLLAIRSQYLQQYFPRTIASLSNIVSQEKPFEETENKNQNVA